MKIYGCGITGVNFLGEESDWKKLLEKLRNLKLFCENAKNKLENKDCEFIDQEIKWIERIS